MLHDPRFSEFIRLFNQEAFFEAHEVLEELWLETSGEQKRFYKGLIQCAVALAHCQRNNPRGAMQVGARALATLKMFESEVEGIEISKLVRECEAFLSSPHSNFPRIQTTID